MRANCRETGAHLRGRLEELEDNNHEIIGDVRGRGLLQVLELVEERNTKTRSPAPTALVREEARENRLLIDKGGMYGNVIRISPPTNIARTDLDQFIGLLDHRLSASRRHSLRKSPP